MAKGLFTVFHDNQPTSLPTSTKPRRAPSSSTTNNKPLAVFSDSKAALGLSGMTSLGKENVDPFLRSKPAGKTGLGGKKPALGSKLAPPAARPSCISLTPSSSSGNGVCTGQLRTRALPSFDDPAPTPAAPILTSALKEAVPVPPSPAYSVASTSSLHSERLGAAGTPNSARDSGYARSVSSSPSSPSSSVGDEGDEGWARSRRGQEEKTVKISEVGSTRRRRSTRKQEISEKEADRRARGLTESPLAEVRWACYSYSSSCSPFLFPQQSRGAALTFSLVCSFQQLTQAFTSLGSFSLPNSNTTGPGSPSPLSSYTKPTRRTSPPPAGKTHSSAKPYANSAPTQTMRKKKPASSGSVPTSLLAGESGVRSMRF